MNLIETPFFFEKNYFFRAILARKKKVKKRNLIEINLFS